MVKTKRRQKIEVPRQYASDEVETALKGIKLQIGNAQHIRIRDEYAKIIKLKELEAGDAIRKKELSRITMSQSARKRDIEQKEKSLLWVIQEVKKQQSTS